MNCADIEILLADYVDGTLAADEKSAFESHLSTCAVCQELASDVAGAVAFMGRASDVTAPPELVTRILFEISERSQPHGSEAVMGAADFRESAGRTDPGAGIAAPLCDGNGDDAALFRHAGPVYWIRGAALDADRSRSGQDLDFGRGSRFAHLAEGREVLRKSAVGL